MKAQLLAPLKWLGILVASAIALLGIVLGALGGLPGQTVIFYAAATFAIILWVWHFAIQRWTSGGPREDDGTVGLGESPAVADAGAGRDTAAGTSGRQVIREIVRNNKWLILGVLLVIAGYIVLGLVLDGFFSLTNTIAGLIILGLVIVGSVLNRALEQNKSAFIGITVLVGLFVVGSFTLEGFSSANNIKAMLVFATFLGLASIGQTLVVLLGGLDLSIPFLIGSANIGLAYLLFLGVPGWLAVICVFVLGTLIGVLNGVLTLRIQGQALILTLGVGFAVSGLTQIFTSIGTPYAGSVHTEIPGWLSNLAAMNGTTFGLDFPPIILIWIVISLIVILGLRHTVYGRNLYALGGNRTASSRLNISEVRYWIGVFGISGFFSSMTGMVLLGWSGGGFIDVGEPYLFETIAAVVIGGTSLLGGWGGYGFTIIGVLVLQVLTTFLIGIGLDSEGQQFVLGLLILPMVALYARSPHIRTQV